MSVQMENIKALEKKEKIILTAEIRTKRVCFPNGIKSVLGLCEIKSK